MRAAMLLTVALFTVPTFAQQAPWLPDCSVAPTTTNICRVTEPPNMTEILNRLSTKDITWWREDDHFSIVARRKADSVRLCCAFQEKMTRIPGTDFWFLSVKSPLLDHAFFDINVANEKRVVGRNEWRGPKAPPAPKRARYSTLHMQSVEVDSPNLGEKRKIEFYLPPTYDPAKRYPVVYLGDGQNTALYALVLEPLIAAQKLPPIILVGVSNNGSAVTIDGQTMQRRTADYILNRTPGNAYFLKHEAFFLKEVMPLAEDKFGASPHPTERLLIGESASADWAIDTALRHPELFARTAGLSPSVAHNGPWGPNQPKLFLTNSQILDFPSGPETASKAKAAGESVTLETHVSSHASIMWDIQFVDALIWAWGTKP